MSLLGLFRRVPVETPAPATDANASVQREGLDGKVRNAHQLEAMQRRKLMTQIVEAGYRTLVQAGDVDRDRLMAARDRLRRLIGR